MPSICASQSFGSQSVTCLYKDNEHERFHEFPIGQTVKYHTLLATDLRLNHIYFNPTATYPRKWADNLIDHFN